MERLVGLCLLMLAVQPLLAKNNYPLTIKVLATKNIEDKNASFPLGSFGSSAAAGWSHRVTDHVYAEGSDGNTYELVPLSPKDMLLSGTFQAKIEKRDMKVCLSKDNEKCREVKFIIVAAEPTNPSKVEAVESTSESK